LPVAAGHFKSLKRVRLLQWQMLLCCLPMSIASCIGHGLTTRVTWYCFWIEQLWIRVQNRKFLCGLVQGWTWL